MEKLYKQKLFEFPVLYQNWECDPTGWIVEDFDGTLKIVLTSHDVEYIGTILELEDNIKYYQDAINDTKKAIDMIKTGEIK